MRSKYSRLYITGVARGAVTCGIHKTVSDPQEIFDQGWERDRLSYNIIGTVRQIILDNFRNSTDSKSWY